MNKSKLNTNQQWLNNLRVAATISVILLHVAAPFLYQFGKISSNTWWIAHIYDSFTRFCVPVFVMITGSLLLSKEIPLALYIQKRLVRVVIPFLFWISIYFLHAGWQIYGNFNSIFTDFSIIKTSKTFLKTTYHFWYIYMILFIYLLIPFLGKWVRQTKVKYLIAILSIWFLSYYYLQAHPPKNQLIHTILNNLYFIGYAVLGYLLSRINSQQLKREKIYSALIFCLGFTITLIGTYYISTQNGQFKATFYQYFAPGVVLSAIGIFIYFKALKIRSPFLVKIINFINSNSFGVYFAHVLILLYINKYGLNYANIKPLLGIPITSMSCLVISMLIIVILKKIGLNKLVN